MAALFFNNVAGVYFFVVKARLITRHGMLIGMYICNGSAYEPVHLW